MRQRTIPEGECKIGGGETLDGRDYFEYMETVIRGRSDPIWWMKEYLGVSFDHGHHEQEVILREWYRHKYNPTLIPYKYLFLLAGMRSGKTALNSMIAVYELFNSVTLGKLPWEYYHLMRNQLVTLAVLSISKDQSDDGMWGNMSAFLDNNTWFSQWTDLVVRADYADVPSKRVGVRVFSSSTQTNIGRSNLYVGLDELDSFESTEGKRGVWKVYSKMSNSIQTFGPDGRLCAISSSSDDPNSAMNTLINDTRDRNAKVPYEQRTFYAAVYPTWVMNTQIKEADLREEYKDNMAAFYRDFACEPGMYIGMEFPDHQRDIVLKKDMVNAFHTMRSRFAGFPRVLTLDPSAKNDAFGAGMAFRMGPKIIVDGVRRFTKNGDEIFINSDDIENFIDQVCTVFNIRALVTDTWMYPNIVQNLMKRNIRVEKHIVYKEDYDRLKGMMKEGTIDVVYDEILERELRGLKVINDKKVDHPLKGSKDMADTVANAAWFLTSAEIMEPVKPRILAIKGW